MINNNCCPWKQNFAMSNDAFLEVTIISSRSPCILPYSSHQAVSSGTPFVVLFSRLATAGKMSQFFSGLKSRTDEVRLKAARNLQKFVSTELREFPEDKYSTVLDEINQNIFGLMSSLELHEKKGGVFAIGKLLSQQSLYRCLEVVIV